MKLRHGNWRLRRGDFRAEWDPAAGRGRIRQSANPYSIDSVLRIVHTLILAQEGGFLLHSAGAIRNGRAFLFSGVSGAGKTTISRLAPPDATLLTDEVSYVRRVERRLSRLRHALCRRTGPRRRELFGAPRFPVSSSSKAGKTGSSHMAKSEAIRRLMRNILFFAEDANLVHKVFQSACEFVERVPVRRLTFTPDPRVWELIR